MQEEFTVFNRKCGAICREENHGNHYMLIIYIEGSFCSAAARSADRLSVGASYTFEIWGRRHWNECASILILLITTYDRT
jgi:hypothetical protein